MEYKNTSLYHRIININNGVKEGIKSLGDYKKDSILEAQKVLIAKSNFHGEPIGTEFDFVVFKKPNFNWQDQKNKEDVLLVAKLLLKKSVDSIQRDIEQDLFKFHSIQALRKLVIIVNNKDIVTKDFIPMFFIKNYDFLLSFPPYTDSTFENCSLCGTSPSKVEPWFYHEPSNELLPILDHIDSKSYF